MSWFSRRHSRSCIELGKSDDRSNAPASMSTNMLNHRPGARVLILLALYIVVVFLLFFAEQETTAYQKVVRWWVIWQHPWEAFPELNGFYNGLRMLVEIPQYKPDYPSDQPHTRQRYPKDVGRDVQQLIEYNPYPEYHSPEYLSEFHPMEPCFIDREKTISPPRVWVHEGLPQDQSEPVFGSYSALGLRDDVCYDRFGRFGPYGLGYEVDAGGSGEGLDAEHEGYDEVWLKGGRIRYNRIDGELGLNWGEAQRQCSGTNARRFKLETATKTINQPSVKTRIPRQALVLRCFTDYEWSEMAVLNLRAMISELSLKSGGEYDVHILLHVKDNPNFDGSNSTEIQRVVQDHIPFEFHDLVTPWSEPLMKTVYHHSFGQTFKNPSKMSIHSAHRSQHMSFAWFGSLHPEYDFLWNWEMDIRYTGHYYELLNSLGIWGRSQPREGLWERSAKYWIPDLHGPWEDFANLVAKENAKEDLDDVLNSTWPGYPIEFPGKTLLEDEPFPPPTGCSPGGDNSLCGIGEDADLIALNPLFDPQDSKWWFSNDISGYELSLPIPPRRIAIIMGERVSSKLLGIMHKEMLENGHTAFSEMFAPTIALHHGMKALYAPNPVFFERKWPLEKVETTFNGGKFGRTGGSPASPFKKQNEHNFHGTTYYYNSEFAGKLWRRWLGYKEADEGGREFEELGSGRMCLRGILLHPIKHEKGVV